MLNDSASIVALVVGTLGFSSAIITLIFSAKHNRKTLDLQLRIDAQDRQKSYNRVMGSLLKTYRSYLNHKMLYAETGVKSIPDKLLIMQLDNLDSFEAEIVYFQQVTNEESEIIPELTIYIHELLDFLNRFKIISKNLSSSEQIEGVDQSLSEQIDQFKLAIKRAHNYSYEELLDQCFLDLLNLISKKADVSEDFMNEVKMFDSEEMASETLKFQEKIKTRMQESINRQLGTEINIDELMKSM